MPGNDAMKLGHTEKDYHKSEVSDTVRALKGGAAPPSGGGFMRAKGLDAGC